MLLSYKWLQQYIDLSGISAHELAERLTRSGVEVDGVHERKQGIEQVVVGYVLDCQQHPNADKLRVCQVDLGEAEPVQIVCGAPNVAQGQKVPVAKVGAVLPGDFKIKKAKLRGKLSQGMICSASELGIEDRLLASEYKDGILVLPDDLELGSSVVEFLDLDDYILDLDLTPNRSDCLSMLGIAYEVGAILDRPVQWPAVELEEVGDRVAEQVQVRINATELCTHYAARLIKGVQIAPSPFWLQNRLIAAGMRPINNVVDVTNFVMLEYGQPLHAFDAAQVQEGQIIVRQAQAGEQVITLDKQTRVLDEEMLVISDPGKVIAIAGVMGAANSEVTAETNAIILESAYFAGPSVRLTSKKLGLRSEASLRFEKGLDPERVQAALDRAAALLAELAGGQVAVGVAEQKVKDFPLRKITVELAQVNKVLGTTLTIDEVKQIFERLRFGYEQQGEMLAVEIPKRRQDLHIKEDLMEEIARLYGYDNIPTSLPIGKTTPGSRNRRQKLRQQVQRYLQGAGLSQALTYSLFNQSNASLPSLLAQEAKPIALAMPMSEERSHMRTSQVPNLLEVVSYNKNRKQADIHLFELGHIFLSDQAQLQELPQEKEVLSAVLTGLWQEHPWQQVKVPVDFFVVKGIVEGLFAKLEIDSISYEAQTLEGYHPGRTAIIKHKQDVIGFLAQVHPLREKELDLAPTYVFELSFEALLEALPEEIAYTPLPKYPSIERDLAIVVSKSIPASELTAAIQETGQPLLTSVHLFDVYEGTGIPEGKRSLAFALHYQDPEQTLTDQMVNEVHEQIITVLESKWQAELRK